jgi:hypothetical protein
MLHERLLRQHDPAGVAGTLSIDPRGTATGRTIYLEQLHAESGPSIVANL